MRTEDFGDTFSRNAMLIALQVGDVAVARERLEAKGVRFVSDTFDSGVCWQAICLDPDGNALSLHHATRRRTNAPPRRSRFRREKLAWSFVSDRDDDCRGGRELALERCFEDDDAEFMMRQCLPVKAGSVPDRLTIWPIDDGRYGLDATFQGVSGYERAERHQAGLVRRGVPRGFRQELDGVWTRRFGPLRAVDVASAVSAFVY